MTKREIIRQGDILLVEVELPQDALPLPHEVKDLVLKYGEATGHAHRIVDAEAKVLVWSAAAERFIQALEPGVQVTHDDHPPVELTPNKTYQLMHQVEDSSHAVPTGVREAYAA